VGTAQTNIDDKMAKGRHRYVTHCKLSDDDVHQIRIQAAAGITQKALAERYGVSGPMVSLIVRGKRR